MAPEDPRLTQGKRDRERQAEIYFRVHAAMLADLGHPLTPGCAVLDFGAGAGATVYRYRRAGFDAYGVDIAEAGDYYRDKMRAEGLLGGDEPLRQLDLSNYRLPFDDGRFDFVFSHQVFEHVQNYDEALAEIRRVLAPGGVSLHVFPPRWSLREAHTFVPFAGAFHPAWYLRLWAGLGLRNQFQQDLGAAETVDYTGDLVAAVRAAHADGVDGLIDLVNRDHRAFAEVTGLVRDGGTASSAVGGAGEEHTIGGVSVVNVSGDAARLAWVADLVAEGALRAAITVTYPLEDAARALEEFTSGHTLGKHLITMR